MFKSPALIFNPGGKVHVINADSLHVQRWCHSLALLMCADEVTAYEQDGSIPNSLS